MNRNQIFDILLQEGWVKPRQQRPKHYDSESVYPGRHFITRIELGFTRKNRRIFAAIEDSNDNRFMGYSTVDHRDALLKALRECTAFDAPEWLGLLDPQNDEPEDETGFDLHQALMDKAHARWNGGEYTVLTRAMWYKHLLEWERAAVVLGHLNRQIENGGVSQYVCNGFAADAYPYLPNILNSMPGPAAYAVWEIVDKIYHDYPEGLRRFVDGEGMDSVYLTSDYYEVQAEFLDACQLYLRSLVPDELMPIYTGETA